VKKNGQVRRVCLMERNTLLKIQRHVKQPAQVR
jgi:hypothetical protein